ncbi:transposase, IS4 family protein [Actinosynnema mirum DSM 43827]|uniref:Transposase, IS4 family protein n=1 Tax=Actinosynnema mirum (strain ATCC 29888 / DSM 43827 / JCM 3225 / NBRC 14064 / NCIMB 13271 / NRRL B-12336 / IMRU 3971 / 101) TaxID=446462 RepID=C6WP89_ACTMD|nr:transposase, IS4 family protein [Actinosynnema mirum DSM 43827]
MRSLWHPLHELLLAELQGANRIGWSRAGVDSCHVRALKGGYELGRPRSTGAGRGPSTT